MGKLRLFWNFMTTKAVKQIFTIYILFNISRGKSNQTMKVGQSIEYNERVFLFKNHEERDISSRLLFIF